ncbi:MAG TPA: hypothetical protein VII07_16415 [Bradyrhizobium sp.]
MNWAWASSFDQIWHSPAFPVWLTLAAAGFFGIIVLVTLLRAEKSVANGALTVITLLAVGIAVAATIRGFGPEGRTASSAPPSSRQIGVALPALSCIDDLAGETVLAACEKALFGAPENAAAALTYAAAQITRLTALGDVATANKSMTPELQAVRRAIERDRYGLMAYVFVARDHCTAADCAAFRALTDYHQIVVNMDERTYEGLVARYAPTWNAPTTPAPVAALAPLVPSMPTGKPTNAEFPTAASTPPVSIMTPEPGTTAAPAPRAAAAAPAASAPVPSPRPPAAALASAKKPAAPKASRSTPAPVQIAPAAPAPAAPAPAASND